MLVESRISDWRCVDPLGLAAEVALIGSDVFGLGLCTPLFAAKALPGNCTGTPAVKYSAGLW